MKMKLIGWIALALLTLLLLIPFLIPMQTYQHQIEQVASAKLGVPVAIQSLHIALLPSPRANMDGIVVGGNAEITVANVAAVLDVTTLFDKVRVVSRLEIHQPVFKQAALQVIKGIHLSDEATIVVRHIEVDEAKLEWQGSNLPVLNAEVAMSDAGKLEKAIIKSADDKLMVEAVPNDNGYVAHIKAKQWTMPVGLPVLFDKLESDISYKKQTLQVSNFNAELYRGKMGLSASLDWRKDWHLQGKFNTQAIELAGATKALGKPVKLSGRISGEGSFSSQSKEAGYLTDALGLDYKFSVTKGVLHGLDLVKAASLLIKQGQSGGETRFDELSGVLKMRGKLLELHQIKVASGLLEATGEVKVMPDKKLSGKIEAALKQSLALVAVPLELSGTIDNPSVKPTKAALIGAVAGTAVLGPAGTALGVKAAGALDKLFGN
ncbi:MAG: AsmA-like C-terminal region-containing protein [Methylophilales bacterium]|nr:AsmA-like C-terminal region-containing protein [Methylophilales bacterium]